MDDRIREKRLQVCFKRKIQETDRNEQRERETLSEIARNSQVELASNLKII